MNQKMDITYFAKTNSRGQETEFGIKDEDRLRHFYVIGKTGMGKSTMFENMAVQDINKGNGLCFIDPHGSAIETFLEYIPEHRMQDVVYFCPFDVESPIAFNVMDNTNLDENTRFLVAQGLLAAFKKIFGEESFSDRMVHILNNTLLALLEYPGATILSVTRMLTDPGYEQEVVSHITDPSVKDFWVNTYATWEDRYRKEANAAILNKLGQFTSNPLIRNIVGQSSNSMDFREIMDNKKILLINLSKGQVGEDNANLLGAMITTKIYLAAMSRADLPKEELALKPNFYLYIDEFQNVVNESFTNILSEARKYKLSLLMAHQYIEQMPDTVRAAIFGNVGTIVSFRVGPEDGEVMEKLFSPTFYADDIVNLGRFEIYLSLMINGIGSQPFSAGTLPPIVKPEIDFTEEVKQLSREKYGSSRAEVNKQVSEWLDKKYQSDKQKKKQEKNATKWAEKKARPGWIEKGGAENNSITGLNGQKKKGEILQSHTAQRNFGQQKDGQSTGQNGNFVFKNEKNFGPIESQQVAKKEKKERSNNALKNALASLKLPKLSGDAHDINTSEKNSEEGVVPGKAKENQEEVVKNITVKKKDEKNKQNEAENPDLDTKKKHHSEKVVKDGKINKEDDLARKTQANLSGSKQKEDEQKPQSLKQVHSQNLNTQRQFEKKKNETDKKANILDKNVLIRREEKGLKKHHDFQGMQKTEEKNEKTHRKTDVDAEKQNTFSHKNTKELIAENKEGFQKDDLPEAIGIEDQPKDVHPHAPFHANSKKEQGLDFVHQPVVQASSFEREWGSKTKEIPITIDKLVLEKNKKNIEEQNDGEGTAVSSNTFQQSETNNSLENTDSHFSVDSINKQVYQDIAEDQRSVERGGESSVKEAHYNGQVLKEGGQKKEGFRAYEVAQGGDSVLDSKEKTRDSEYFRGQSVDIREMNMQEDSAKKIFYVGVDKEDSEPAFYVGKVDQNKQTADKKKDTDSVVNDDEYEISNPFVQKKKEKSAVLEKNLLLTQPTKETYDVEARAQDTEKWAHDSASNKDVQHFDGSEKISFTVGGEAEEQEEGRFVVDADTKNAFEEPNVKGDGFSLQQQSRHPSLAEDIFGESPEETRMKSEKKSKREFS